MKKILIALALLLSGCANDPAMTSAAMMALGNNTGSTAKASTDAGTAALVAELAGNRAGQKRYDCADLTPEQAQLLLDQGHTYLDPEHDNIACGKLSTESAAAAQEKATALLAAAAGVDVDVPNLNVGRAFGGVTKYASTGVANQYRCADISDARAQQLYLAGHTYLDSDGDGDACEPDARRDYSPRTSNCTWVNGYTRKNGTHVRGHQRCG